MRMRYAASLSLFAIGLSFTGSALGAQATASVCKDGTTSAAAGRGACSGHGGVNAKATKKAMKAEAKMDKAQAKAESKMDKGESKAEAKMDKAQGKAEARMDKSESRRGEDNDATGAIAQCKDGMYSHAKTTRGACSRHGGISKKM